MLRLLPLLLPLTACSEPTSGCLAGREPSLELGTGERGYVPLDEVDNSLELIHGPQGGFHLLVGLQARHIATERDLEGSITGRIDGAVIATSEPFVTFRCNGPLDALQAWNILLIYDAQPEDLDGKQTFIEAELVDADGETLRATTEVAIYDPNL